MHISTLQRNELELDAYMKVEHLTVNTHGLEWNFTSKKLQETEKRHGFRMQVHPYHLQLDYN